MDAAISFGSLESRIITRIFTSLAENPFLVAQTLNQTQSLPRLDFNSLNADLHISDDDEDVDDFNVQQLKVQYEKLQQNSYQLDLLRGSQWQTIEQLLKHPHEGVMSLFKGWPMYCVQQLIEQFMQPWLEDAFNEHFDLYDLRVLPLHELPLWPWENVSTLLGSHLIVGLLCSPLEMARVRMVVQSADPLRRTFNNSMQAMFPQMATQFDSPSKQMSTFGYITDTVKRWSFRSPTLLLTVAYKSFDTVLTSCQTMILTRLLHLERPDYINTGDYQYTKVQYDSIDTQSSQQDYKQLANGNRDAIMWFAGSLALMTVKLLITLPMETLLRRRYLYQQRNMEFGFRQLLRPIVKYPCIQLDAGIPYHSIAHMRQIIANEAISTNIQQQQQLQAKTRKTRSFFRDGVLGGVAQLYRGFWYQCTANVLTSLISTLFTTETSTTSSQASDYYN